MSRMKQPEGTTSSPDHVFGFLPDVRRFPLRLPNGFGIALLGTVSAFLTASRKRSNASGPSIMSRVAGFNS